MRLIEGYLIGRLGYLHLGAGCWALLLLMIPNLYRWVGELLPVVVHVASRALAAQAAGEFNAEITPYQVLSRQPVQGSNTVKLRELLAGQGMDVSAEIAPMAQRLGLRVSEAGGSVHIKGVLRGSAAEAAGLAAGDEWLGVDVGASRAARTSGAQGGSWRLNKLDDLPALLGKAHQLVALVSRDKRLLRLPLKVPEQASSWKLAMPAGRKQGWPSV